jgi:hypothetical protein
MLQSNLLSSPNDTVVVAANKAWGEYQRLHAYIHQPNRTYIIVPRLAFYANQHIQPLVPSILATFPSILLDENALQPDPRLRSLIIALLAEQPDRRGKTEGIFLLSAPDSPDTLHLAASIRNDQVDKNGKTTAYTAGHRYTRQSQLEKIANLSKSQRVTSALNMN